MDVAIWKMFDYASFGILKVPTSGHLETQVWTFAVKGSYMRGADPILLVESHTPVCHVCVDADCVRTNASCVGMGDVCGMWKPRDEPMLHLLHRRLF